jgi:hypothetical protein
MAAPQAAIVTGLNFASLGSSLRNICRFRALAFAASFSSAHQNVKALFDIVVFLKVMDAIASIHGRIAADVRLRVRGVAPSPRRTNAYRTAEMVCEISAATTP